MNCKKCFAPLALGAKFCTLCGTKFPQEAHDTNCTKCGAPVDPNARLCTSCGNPLSAEALPDQGNLAAAEVFEHAPDDEETAQEAPRPGQNRVLKLFVVSGLLLVALMAGAIWLWSKKQEAYQAEVAHAAKEAREQAVKEEAAKDQQVKEQQVKEQQVKSTAEVPKKRIRANGRSRPPRKAKRHS